MKIESEIYADDLKDVKGVEAFEIYENLYYVEQEKFNKSAKADLIKFLKLNLKQKE
ncbi:hypothetical protein ACD574_02375 [Campylobacter sp. LH-2024]|uniref:hypothetical protein n=1 Tax=Campylobacter sp. LH-2024 TaxID=3239825 RepID=UPI003B805172